MDQIFAPWRIDWIERDDKNEEIDGCVFCELPEMEDDRDNLILVRSEHSFVILNNYPYNPGHLMVVPRQHTGEYEDLRDGVLRDHARLKQLTFEAVREGLDPDGFNTGLNLGHGSGGSIDDHLHTHVVPRWKGDTNFMPATSDTKVIVEAIDETYDRLYDAFESIDGVVTTDDGNKSLTVEDW